MPRKPTPPDHGQVNHQAMMSRHPGGGCWTCSGWLGEFSHGGRHITCRGKHGPTTIHGMDRGCAFWEREIGADDEVVYRDERRARGWFAPEFNAPGPPKPPSGQR